MNSLSPIRAKIVSTCRIHSHTRHRHAAPPPPSPVDILASPGAEADPIFHFLQRATEPRLVAQRFHVTASTLRVSLPRPVTGDGGFRVAVRNRAKRPPDARHCC
ncbi:unnamed protein product [Cercospora beticola]|nr:unnamed protein product [Cercospora beticola]